MKISFDRGAILDGLKMVAKAAPSRSPKPILQNILCRAGDGCVALYATDSEIGVQWRTSNVTIDESGDVLFPASLIVSIIDGAPDGRISMETSGQCVVIKSISSEFELPIVDPAEFPIGFADQGKVVEESCGSITIESGLLKSAIQRTIFAADDNNSRFALEGICVDFRPSDTIPELYWVDLVATDSRRLAWIACGCRLTLKKPKSVPIVPGRAMAIIERCLPDDQSKVFLSISDSEVSCRTGDTIIVCRRLEGRFPPYSVVVRERSDETFEVLAGQLTTAFKQVSIVTSEDSRRVTMTLGDGEVSLESKASSLGRSRIAFPVSRYGVSIQIDINPFLVLDYLKHVAPEHLVIIQCMRNGTDSVLFRDGQRSIYVVMPLSS